MNTHAMHVCVYVCVCVCVCVCVFLSLLLKDQERHSQILLDDNLIYYLVNSFSPSESDNALKVHRLHRAQALSSSFSAQ